jgi:hypothetical protein
MGFAQGLLGLAVNVLHLAGNITMDPHQLPGGLLHCFARGVTGFPGGLAGFAGRGLNLPVMLRCSQNKQRHATGGMRSYRVHGAAAHHHDACHGQSAQRQQKFAHSFRPSVCHEGSLLSMCRLGG